MARDNNNGQFLPGESANPARKFAPGNPTRFQPGQSGNPAGKPRSRVQFEQVFAEALVSMGSPEEAAKLLWERARAGEAWALQSICTRFAPQTQSLRLIHERKEDDAIDYSKLSDEQIEQLESILEQAAGEPLTLTGGEGAAPAE